MTKNNKSLICNLNCDLDKNNNIDFIDKDQVEYLGESKTIQHIKFNDTLNKFQSQAEAVKQKSNENDFDELFFTFAW